METNYESEWGSCQSRVCRMGVGGDRSTSQSSGTVVMSNDGASRDVSQRTDDHGKREPSQSSEVPPCGGSRLAISLAFGANLGEISARYSPFGVSAQATFPPPLSCVPRFHGVK